MDDIKVGSLSADLEIIDKTGKPLEQARASLERVRAVLETVDKEYGQAGDKAEEFARKAAESAKAYQVFASAMTGGAGAAENIGRVNAKLGEGKSAASQFAMGMMHVGYVVDDLQYSLASTVNNVGPLAMAFGAGAGLAGALQIAAVAGSQLYNNWDLVTAAFGDTSGIDRARESVDGMEKSVQRLSDAIKSGGSLNPFAQKVAEGANDQLRQDIDRLEQLKDAEKSAKAMDDGRSEAEKKAGKRFEEAVRESGGTSAISRKMADFAVENNDPTAFLGASESAAYKAAKAVADRSEALGVPSPTAQGTIDKLKEQAKQKADEEYRALVGRAAVSGDARSQLLSEMKGVPGLGDAEAMLSGRAQTSTEREKAEKDRKQAEEKAERDRKQQQKDEDDRNRQFRAANLELARRVMPGLTGAARDAQNAIDAGGNAGDEQLSLAARLERAGMAGPDAALAAKDALAEQAKVDPETRRKRREQEAEQARRERERGARDAIGRAEERVPGLKDRVEEQVAAATVAGGRLSDVKAIIARELMASGAANGEQEAMDAAGQLAAEGRKSVADKVRNAALRPAEVSSSQTMEASDLARSAQAGVKNDENAKKFDRMIELLAEGVKNGQNVLNVRID